MPLPVSLGESTTSATPVTLQSPMANLMSITETLPPGSPRSGPSPPGPPPPRTASRSSQHSPNSSGKCDYIDPQMHSHHSRIGNTFIELKIDIHFLFISVQALQAVVVRLDRGMYQAQQLHRPKHNKIKLDCRLVFRCPSATHPIQRMHH